MNIKKYGEFELIRNLTKKLPAYSKEVVKGVGDDCAVIKQNKDSFLLATCDTQVANVHFFPEITNSEKIGQKAIAVNISDIAAMGGKPTFTLVSLIIPEDYEPEQIEKIYSGIKITCTTYGVQILGGNISKGEQLVIDIFMMGEVKPDELLLRSGAKPGDKILVTGTLGIAAAGFELLKNKKLIISDKDRSELILKQTSPIPRLTEASVIAQLQLATSMIDISDGLASDIRHICDQSKVGAEIYEDKIPLNKSTIQIARQLKRDPLTFALTGGEDYELLFTVQEKNADKIISSVNEKTGTPVSIIGEILPQNAGVKMKKKNGNHISLSLHGWNHFK